MDPDSTARHRLTLKGIDHIVLRANDADRLVRFYVDVLGCRIEREIPELGLIQLRAGNSLIDVVPVAGTLGRRGGRGPGPEGRNLEHFCLLVEGISRDALREHLRAHGLDHTDFERRYGATGYGDSLYVEDPEANIVELKLHD